MIDLSVALKRLRALPPAALPSLAQRCGVPLGTVHKIYYGHTNNPRMDTLQALIDQFDIR